MKLFFDTCTLVDFICNRKNAQLIDNILEEADRKEWMCYISVGSFYTLTYLVELYLKHNGYSDKEERIEKLRELLLNILNSFSISEISSESLLVSVNDRCFSDIEDSYQYRAALNAGCEYLITDNTKDFKMASTCHLKILSPQDFATIHLR